MSLISVLQHTLAQVQVMCNSALVSCYLRMFWGWLLQSCRPQAPCSRESAQKLHNHQGVSCAVPKIRCISSKRMMMIMDIICVVRAWPEVSALRVLGFLSSKCLGPSWCYPPSTLLGPSWCYHTTHHFLLSSSPSRFASGTTNLWGINMTFQQNVKVCESVPSCWKVFW